MIRLFWASLRAQLVKKICLRCRRLWFDPWVGKIPWRRESLPTPVFRPGEFHRLYGPWSCKESDTTERLSLSLRLFWTCENTTFSTFGSISFPVFKMMSTLISEMKTNWNILSQWFSLPLCKRLFETLIKAKKKKTLPSTHKNIGEHNILHLFQGFRRPPNPIPGSWIRNLFLKPNATQLQENALICHDDLDSSSTIHLSHGYYWASKM